MAIQSDRIAYKMMLSTYEVNMTIINELNSAGGAKDIEVKEDIAYVLSNVGLEIYDVSDPMIELELGNLHSDGYLGHSLAVYNNFVFAAAFDKGLKIINVTDSSNPTLAATYSNTHPSALFIHEELLFISNWEHDFEIYNISDAPTIKEVTRFDGNGFYYTYADDNHAFAFANNGTLLIVDISNSDSIQKTGQIDNDKLSCITTKGDIWYIGGSDGIMMYNTSNPSEPELLSQYIETETSSMTNLAIIDDIVYASDYHLGFRIFEVMDSKMISEIGCNTVGGAPLGFFVLGDYAYVASQNEGIQIVKVQISERTNKETPLEIGFCLFSLIVIIIFSKKLRKDKYQ
ncbi:MAG: LVIVD repeat-containing protein [Promethearchaeota archaeon]